MADAVVLGCFVLFMWLNNLLSHLPEWEQKLFCNFAEYLQNTAEVLEVKPKEIMTGLLSDFILWVIPWIPAGCMQIHNNLSA